MIKVVVKKPSGLPETVEINNDLKSLQQLVGGYIEITQTRLSGVQMVLNEEGKLNGLEPNFYYGNDTLVGNVVFVSHDSDGEMQSLTDKQVKNVLNLFD